jgi:hypothetical protein
MQTVANLKVPASGSRIIPVDLDFSTNGPNPAAPGTAIAFDLVQEIQRTDFDFVQSVFIDNSINAETFTLTTQGVGGFGNIISVEPFSQGHFPLYVEGEPRFVGLTTQQSVVPLIFLNIALPYMVWQCAAPLQHIAPNFAPLAVGDNVLGPAAVAGKSIKLYRLMVDVSAPTNVQFFDGPSAGAKPLSGVITLGAQGSLAMNLDRVPTPWLHTSVGNALILNSSAGVNLGGMGDVIQS